MFNTALAIERIFSKFPSWTKFVLNSFKKLTTSDYRTVYFWNSISPSFGPLL